MSQFLPSAERMAQSRQRAAAKAAQRALLKKLQKSIPKLEKDEDGRELCPFCGWGLNEDPKRCPKCKEVFS